MDKLSIFQIEDASTKEYDAIRVKLFPGENIEDAVIGFNRIVFENNQSLLYSRLKKKLGDEDTWECNEDFTDCVKVSGEAKRVACRKHYRFERDAKGNIKKASPERVISFVKLVAFRGDTIESELERYLNQIPDELFLEDEEEKEGEE